LDKAERGGGIVQCVMPLSPDVEGQLIEALTEEGKERA